MAGDRQLVRNAVAAYFGGTLQTADAGVYYQGGPLAASGLGTAFPYKIKRGAPDSAYTLGEADGTGWGAVMTVGLGVTTLRDSYGGATSGWRARRYRITCAFDVISYLPHLETTEAAFDDLVNGMDSLVYADRTLGTTSPVYAAQGGRLIIQAGEKPYGIVHGEPVWSVEGDRGRGEGGMEYTFEVLTMVAA
jgi:hypothetical protein